MERITISEARYAVEWVGDLMGKEFASEQTKLLADFIAQAEADAKRIGELEKIVAKIWHTADKVAIVPEMMLWPLTGHIGNPFIWRGKTHLFNDGIWLENNSGATNYRLSELYSTHEAAISALKFDPSPSE